MDSSPWPLLQPSHGFCEDGDGGSTADFCKQPSCATPRTCARLSGKAPSLRGRRSPSSSSSSPPSPSSSSSCDSLSPSPFDFKQSSARRHQRQPGRFPLPRRPCMLKERINDFRAPVTQMSPAVAESLKFRSYQTPSLSRSADPTASIPIREGRPRATAQLQDSRGMHPECASNHHDDLDQQKKNRKLLVWRAACAMAHAYICQLDANRHEDCQTKLSHDRFHQDKLHKDGSQQDIHGVQPSQPVKTVHSLPPCSPINISSKDEVLTSSVCPSNDVVSIDEVVNPTQAAEWFGTLFLSTSTLVS